MNPIIVPRRTWLGSILGGFIASLCPRSLGAALSAPSVPDRLAPDQPKPDLRRYWVEPICDTLPNSRIPPSAPNESSRRSLFGELPRMPFDPTIKGAKWTFAEDSESPLAVRILPGLSLRYRVLGWRIWDVKTEEVIAYGYQYTPFESVFLPGETFTIGFTLDEAKPLLDRLMRGWED